MGGAGSERRTVLFVGVRTAQSRVHALFAPWMDALGLGEGVQLRGVDLPLDSPPPRYRALVAEMAADARVAGAVITSHKLALVAAAGDLLCRLDPLAQLTREVSCLRRDGDCFAGHAGDPLAAAAVLDEMLPAGHWSDGERDVLCLGAGGAATAIAVALLGASDEPDGASRSGQKVVPAPAAGRPRRLCFSDVRPERLASLRAVVERLSPPPIRFVPMERGEPADALLADLPAGSLVINATGLGKDVPGSPLSDHARLPLGAVVWELNYRGDLAFLAQARRQERNGGLRIHDGWRYFLHGWFEALTPILGLAREAGEFARLAAASERALPGGAGAPPGS